MRTKFSAAILTAYVKSQDLSNLGVPCVEPAMVNLFDNINDIRENGSESSAYADIQSLKW